VKTSNLASVYWLCYRLDDRGSIPGSGNEGNFSPSRSPRLWSPASYPMGTGEFSPEIKRLRPEGDQSPPSSSELKKAWSCISTPHTSSRCGTYLSTGITVHFTCITEFAWSDWENHEQTQNNWPWRLRFEDRFARKRSTSDSSLTILKWIQLS
jgi:hypothetical protein